MGTLQRGSMRVIGDHKIQSPVEWPEKETNPTKGILNGQDMAERFPSDPVLTAGYIPGSRRYK